MPLGFTVANSLGITFVCNITGNSFRYRAKIVLSGFMYNLGGQKFQSVLSLSRKLYQHENLHKIITVMSRIADLLTTSTMG